MFEIYFDCDSSSVADPDDPNGSLKSPLVAVENSESAIKIPSSTCKWNPFQQHVIVLGATNRPDSLDPALRRAGRFDREISMGIPSEKARLRILKVMCKKLRLDGEMDFRMIAQKTPGGCSGCVGW